MELLEEWALEMIQQGNLSKEEIICSMIYSYGEYRSLGSNSSGIDGGYLESFAEIAYDNVSKKWKHECRDKIIGKILED